MLDLSDNPFPDCMAGNCVASASGRAYWAGGSTLGPIIGFAYRAANQANKEVRGRPSHGRPLGRRELHVCGGPNMRGSPTDRVPIRSLA